MAPFCQERNSICSRVVAGFFQYLAGRWAAVVGGAPSPFGAETFSSDYSFLPKGAVPPG